MLAWMLYVVLITLLLSAAGLAAERAARLRRARTRWIWVLTILASLALPTIIASVSVQVPSLMSPTVSRKLTALREMTSIQVAPLTWVRERTATAPNLNRMLQRTWIAVSAGVLAALLLNAARAFWRKRRWRISTVAGASVCIAPEVGPAVVGLLRPRIVVPNWLTEVSLSQQTLVIAHEKAHVTRHDPQVLTVALLLLVLMPWNLPLWWQLHRLRQAIEVDCDARVLERGADACQYGEMLKEVSQRPSGYVGALAAMAESRSFLGARVAIMGREAARWRSAVAVMFGGLALVLVAVAAEVTPPNVQSLGGGVSVAPEVLERYVGFYVRGGHWVAVITRKGSHLFGQYPGASPVVELYPDTEKDFRASVDTDQQFTFVLDVRGQVTGLLEHWDRPKLAYVWPRVDGFTAEQILSSNEAKYRSQSRAPGSEAALRRMIDGVRNGKCIDEEAAWFKKLCEETMEDAHWEKIYADWGAVQSVEFRRVDVLGRDVYEVRQEHGRSEWRIYLDAGGVVQDAANERAGE